VWPHTSTRPADGVSVPETQRSRVVLPEPLGPVDGKSLARGQSQVEVPQDLALAEATV
jgi:hypothetical protein